MVFVSDQVTEWGPYTYKVIRQREEISDEDEGKERIRFAMRGTYRYIPGITYSQPKGEGSLRPRCPN